MRFKVITWLFGIMSIFSCQAQVAADRASCENEAFDKAVSRWLSLSVPTQSVEDLATGTDSILILDAREKEEFMTSHIEGARHIGYDDFDISILDDVAKDKKIVVYCSIGYRSEKIGEKLQQAGFKDVKNLYGSIFEWANKGYPLVDAQELPTKKIHTYNKRWSKWMLNDKYEKVW